MSPETSGTIAVPSAPAATAGAQPGTGSDAAPGSGALAKSHSVATSGAAAAAPLCANCGTPVPLRFCGNCGQRRDHALRSLWHFLREATEDLTHADSRLWSTLAALMFRPGFLTREFLEGHRARYLPPLRLYLVLSVVFFLIIGSVDQETRVVKISTKIPVNGAPTVSVEPQSLIDLTPRPGETREQAEERACNPHYDGPAQSVMTPLLSKGCHAMAQDGGRGLREVFLHNAPRALFLFLPVVAMVMMTMYWRPRRYYVEHLLFFIHNHAFAFLLLTLLTLLTRLLPGLIGDAVTVIAWLYVPYYLFVAMRRVYGQSRRRTFMKLTVLSVAYLMGMLLTIGLTGLYSMWTA